MGITKKKIIHSIKSLYNEIHKKENILKRNSKYALMQLTTATKSKTKDYLRKIN